jgi:hypothetical protein
MQPEDQLVNLRVEVEMLRGEVAGLRLMLTALAARVEALKPEDSRTRELLMIASRYAEVMESPAAGLVARQLVRDLAIWTQEVDPAQLLAVLVLQAEAAGAQRRQALQSWLADASVDEIAEDMRETLRRLREQQGGGQEDGRPGQSGS